MFTRGQAQEILEDVIASASEMDEAECKSSAGDRVQDAVCAMSNRRDRNGGIVFVGVGPDYRILGVDEVEQAQERIVNQANDSFNVPLRVSPEILVHDGRTVLAVIVPPVPPGYRPCHFKKHSPFDGAWIRSGNSTRRMTHDEVQREIAADALARGLVPSFDMMPILDAGIDLFDEALISHYVGFVRENRPGSQIDLIPQQSLLAGMHAIAKGEDGEWHPTPAGLLFFCRDPQRFLPQSGVEFMHLWGPELTTLGPDGSHWRLNRELVGTLPEMIDQAEVLLLERVATRGHLDSFRRRDEPEYPRFVLREAVVNAVAHRDYTLRGSRIQIRLYPHGIEIHTPGGLPAPVTVDNIEDEQATRNEAIVTLLQDFHYMDRRGYGFNRIVASMREAGLAPPLLTDNGASFNLLLKNHVLMSPDALAWLRQFGDLGLSPQERLGLAYLRVNDRLYNRDYVRLADCTSTEATQALRRMVGRGVLEMQGNRGGAYYVLPKGVAHADPVRSDAPASDAEKVLILARRDGRVNADVVRQELGWSRGKTTVTFRLLVADGALVPHGRTKGRYYAIPGDSSTPE